MKHPIKFFNIFIVAVMMLELILPVPSLFAQAKPSSAPQNLSPSEAGLPSLAPNLPNLFSQPFIEPQDLALQQALGEDSNLFDTNGLVRLEAFGNEATAVAGPPLPVGSPQLNTPAIPAITSPVVNTPLEELGNLLAGPTDPTTFAPSQDNSQEADSSSEEADSSTNANATTPASTASTAASRVPLLPMGQSGATPSPLMTLWQNIRAIEPQAPNQPNPVTFYSVYLPFITTPWPQPADEVLVTPEQSSWLISTDGQMMVFVPAHAYTEPFILRYAPAQQLTYGFTTLDAVTLAGESVTLNHSAMLYLHLSGTRSGKPLVVRYRGQSRTISLAATLTVNPIATQTQRLEESNEFLMTPIYDFGQFTYASLDGDDTDEGEDGLIIRGYCWEPGELGGDYVFSFAGVSSTTEEANPTGEVLLSWKEVNENGEPYQEYSFIAHDPDPQKNDFSGEPNWVSFGFQETDGQTVPNPEIPVPHSKLLTTTVVIYEPFPLRYDFLDTKAYFEPGVIGCASGCEGIPPAISSIKLTQISEMSALGNRVGFGRLEISASDNSGEITVAVKVNGHEYTTAKTNKGTFTTTTNVLYKADDWNIYEIVVTDSCGNAINFPRISAFGAKPAFNGSYLCLGCGGFQGKAGDPVNTQNGNYFDSVNDLTIAGVGGADLILNRDYNSKSALWTAGSTVAYTDDGSGTLTEEIVAGPPQYFGTAWTFPYAISVNHLDLVPVYDGVEIHYPDGHSATFVNEGGSYVSHAPANFDTLTQTGEGWTLLHKNSLEVDYFDADGRLIEQQDRNGNSVFLTYSGDLLTKIQNDSGRWLEFAYNSDGFITAVTAPENRTITYDYADGLLTSVTDGNGHTTTYTYDANKQLTAITTPKGHTALSQTYNENYRVVQQKIGRAEVINFAYSEDGLTTTTTDSYGNATTHTYNELGQLVATQDAAGYVEAFGYNDKFQRTYHKDRNGHEWFYTYDERGNRLTLDGPLGWHQEWRYNELNRVTYIKDSLSRETLFEYDSRGNVTNITNPLTDSSTITYDERGLPTHVFDFNQNETINTYDPATGDLLRIQNGAGDTTSFTYDGLGRVKTLTDGNGNVYTNFYNQTDQVTAVDGPLGYHIEYSYDANNNLESQTDANGGVSHFTYDASEMPTQARNPLNHTSQYIYDDNNNLITFVDAEGRVWGYEYDAVYNQTAVHGPEDTHSFMTYDGNRQVTSLNQCNSTLVAGSCADHRLSTLAYDALDRVVSQTQNAQLGAPANADTNVTTGFAYDLAGNLLTLTDANGNQTHYRYDDLNRLIEEKSAENQMSAYDYDANGNLIRLTNPRGFATTWQYDGANRMIAMQDADAQVWGYAYDHNGNLLTQTDPLAVVTEYTYDALNRASTLIQNSVPGGAHTSDQNVTTSFEYDLVGNLRFVHDPRGGYTTEYRYDAANRRIRIIDNEDGETVYTYDKVNNLRSVVDGNGHETTVAYDGLNRQTQITNPEGHFVQMSYDRLSNLLQLTDARGYPTAFTYDGMNRVILMVDAMGGKWQYAYDAMGNLLQSVDANGHANNGYTYDKVYRLLTSTDAEGHTTSYTYDPNNNTETVTDGNNHVTHLTYDVLDRLATLTNAEEETTTYGYDPLGNQTRLIEADGIVTRYDYDPLYRLAVVNQNDQPGQPESADVNVDTHYRYDEVGNLLTIVDGNEHETHFSYDGLNRLVEEVDADGFTWQYGYDFVGNRTWRIDANGNLSEYTYYPDDQLKQISYELDETTVSYSYDENNNPVQMGDHLGTTTWVYDPLNRVTDVTDAFGRHLGYGYDAVGNRTRLTYHDGRSVLYAYYKNNWLYTVTDPENNVTSYERDGVGLMVFTSNPNDTTSTATYDKANRMLTLVNKQIVGAQTTNSAFSYTYNDVGHRTQMIAEYGWRNPAIVISDYTYDGLRRLIRDEDSEGVWTDFTYDRVGNRLSLTTNDDSESPRPFDELQMLYSYADTNRLLTAVGNTHPGDPSTHRQDNVGQAIYAFVHEVEAQDGRHIEHFAAQNLLLMAGGLIAELEGNPVPSETEVATAVEALRQQVQSDRAAGLIDSNGIANSLLVKLDLADEVNNNGNNSDLQTETYTYDANGNRINKEYPGPQGPRVQGTDYTYDPENRLIVAWDYQENLQGNRVDRAITTLEYDGDGRRLAKTYDPNEGGGGAKRVEVVFDGWDPVAEYQMWNPQYENFYRGEQNRIITMHHFPSGTAGQMYWYHYDGLGSVSGLTKQSGQSSHNYRYEAYGQIEMPPGNFSDPHNHYTYTGQEWDENMGLYEFHARVYDPHTTHWLTQDTYRGQLSNPSSQHRFMYVLDNPTNYIDKYGFYTQLDADLYNSYQGWEKNEGGYDSKMYTSHYDSDDAVNMVLDNKDLINEMAQKYDIPAGLLAATLAFETDFDYDNGDSRQDWWGDHGVRVPRGDDGVGIMSVNPDGLAEALEYINDICNISIEYNMERSYRTSDRGSIEAAAIFLKALMLAKGVNNRTITLEDQAVIIGAFHNGVDGLFGNGTGYDSIKDFQNNVASGTGDLSDQFKVGQDAYRVKPYVVYTNSAPLDKLERPKEIPLPRDWKQLNYYMAQ